MTKPTRYLWKTKETLEEEIQEQKEHWTKMGYRAVIFREGDGDIHGAFKKSIKIHMVLTDI